MYKSSTHHSIASSRPSPLIADVLKIWYFRFLTLDKPSASATSVTDMAPWRGGKGMLYEGGIRVPFFVVWPGRADPGTVIDEMVTTLDLTATSLVAGGGEIPDEFDGVNLLPRLLGKANKVKRDEPMVWGFWQTYAVRDGDWKLWRSNTHELLFNVADDP